MNIVDKIDAFLCESKSESLPSVKSFLSDRKPFSSLSKRLQNQLRAHWYNGGHGIKQSDFDDFDRAVNRVYSDMSSEWREGGYSEEEIESASIEAAIEELPHLRHVAFFRRIQK